MSKGKRQYVTYWDVYFGLNWDQARFISPAEYLRVLREETGLSWEKLAHDLSVDSGCKVSACNAKRWAEEW